MNKKIKDLVLAAMFLALGFVLPFLTGQVPQIGSMLLPMHIAVMLCGIVVNKRYGALVGFITPILRSFILGMPPMFPTAFAMAFELMTYGFVIGLVWERSKYKCIFAIYKALIASMIAGRIVWAIVMTILSISSANVTFGLTVFITSAFINAVPGIILQLILIPVVVYALGKLNYLQFDTSDLKKEG